MIRIVNFIGGELVRPLAGAYLDILEPSTGQVYALAPDSGERDVGCAIDAAGRAFPGWSGAPARERSRVLLRLADLVERNLEKFAFAESRDTGKPLWLAREIDIPRAVQNLRFFATAILHDASEAHITDTVAINYTLRQPRGVAGLIAPWNLPLYLLTWKLAPALATGNTVVGKPSELTPMTAYLLGEICTEAGIPPGVVNIVHGVGGNCGGALVRHPDVPTISFTGSTSTGAAIAGTAGPMFKRVALELGGKNANIIFADANLRKAVPVAVKSAFTNQGEICLCGSRIFVERPVFHEFVDRFVEEANRLKVGDPLDPSSDLGALISRAHLKKAERVNEFETLPIRI